MNGSIEIKLSTIKTSNRIRKDYTGVNDLAESIKANGLIQPLVVNTENELVAGGRRYRALLKLEETHAQCVVLETLDEAHLRLLEMEENLQRRDFTWQENAIGILRVHEAKISQSHKMIDTKWGIRETGKLLGVSKTSVHTLTVLATHIRKGDKSILKCSNAAEAMNVLLTRREAELNRVIASRNLQPAPNKAVKVTKAKAPNVTFVENPDESKLTPDFSSDVEEDDFFSTPLEVEESTVPAVGVPILELSHLIQNDDCMRSLDDISDSHYDAVITDFPYGIEMDNLDNVESTKAEHDVAKNLTLFEEVIPELYRVLKDKSYFVTFCDAMNFRLLHDIGIASGFAVQRWPLVWFKSSGGKNAAPKCNTTKNYELAIVMRKGTGTLLQKPMTSSIFVAPNLAPKKYGHPFAKPADLWLWLYEHFVPENGKTLDPFAGSGSSLAAALVKGYEVHGIELIEQHFNSIPGNVLMAYKELGLDIRLE